jgi:hypothetical protein
MIKVPSIMSLHIYLSFPVKSKVNTKIICLGKDNLKDILVKADIHQNTKYISTSLDPNRENTGTTNPPSACVHSVSATCWYSPK